MDEEAAGRPRFTALRAFGSRLADRDGGRAPSGHDAVDPGGGEGEGESRPWPTTGAGLRPGLAPWGVRAPNDVTPCRRVRLAEAAPSPLVADFARIREQFDVHPEFPDDGRGGGARGCRTAAGRRRPRRPARPRVLHGRPAGLDGPRPGDAARTPGRRRAPRALRHRRRRPFRRSGGTSSRPRRGGAASPCTRPTSAARSIRSRSARVLRASSRRRTGRRWSSPSSWTTAEPRPRRPWGARSSEAATSSTTPTWAASARRSCTRSPGAASPSRESAVRSL